MKHGGSREILARRGLSSGLLRKDRQDALLPHPRKAVRLTACGLRRAKPIFGRLARTAAWVGIIAVGVLLFRRVAAVPGDSWLLAASFLTGALVYGLYLWRLECPRLLALWRQEG